MGTTICGQWESSNFQSAIYPSASTFSILATARPVSRQSKSMNESEVGLLIRGRAASSRRN